MEEYQQPGLHGGSAAKRAQPCVFTQKMGDLGRHVERPGPHFLPTVNITPVPPPTKLSQEAVVKKPWRCSLQG